ncbi:MAG: carboxypeptidase-like regulatory domain-containing protein, partial [Candidatus Thermoplasmatota archaeon]
DGKLTFTIQIHPKVLIATIEAPSELESRKNASLELYVADYIAPVANATVTISSDYGAVEPMQAKTDENGKVRIIFTAPETKSKITSTITVTISKEGYPTAVKYFYITILPEKEAPPVTVSLVIYCSLFIIPPIVGVVVALGIIRKKR